MDPHKQLNAPLHAGREATLMMDERVKVNPSYALDETDLPGYIINDVLRSWKVINKSPKDGQPVYNGRTEIRGLE